jgi:hypothetical protein
VTYRNQLGNTGTHGWLGDVFASEGWQPGGIHYGDEISIKDGYFTSRTVRMRSRNTG